MAKKVKIIPPPEVNVAASLPTTLSSEKIHPHREERLDVFLARELDRSRTIVKGLIDSGHVHLRPHAEKVSPSYRLRGGDSIVVDPISEVKPPERPVGEDIPLSIIHEDEYILVIDKPAGLVVHPAAGHAGGTLVNALVHHCGEELAERGGEARLGLVHRLDKDTSGLIVVAKTDKAHELLAAQFAERTTKKMYLALCLGQFRHKNGSCKGAIGRHKVHRQKMTVLARGGRASHTDYKVIKESSLASWVECVLHTGRTHQIRVHMTHHGHPILGDTVYGRALDKRWKMTIPRQMLHSAFLGFKHPHRGKWVEFSSPAPVDFQLCWQQLVKIDHP